MTNIFIPAEVVRVWIDSLFPTIECIEAELEFKAMSSFTLECSAVFRFIPLGKIDIDLQSLTLYVTNDRSITIKCNYVDFGVLLLVTIDSFFSIMNTQWFVLRLDEILAISCW